MNILRADRMRGLENAAINDGAYISVWPESNASSSTVQFGENVYVGRDVEIAAIGPGSIRIGDHVSFQDRCQIYGDVSIGSYCIFAKNVLAISTVHQTKKNPAWLIRDQDKKFLADAAQSPERAGRLVQIEEDCWLGWSCAIMPGVYIGKGAVIGANCVVTRDVAPYEIHGGTPNRRINTRLDFCPPKRITAQDDAFLPYFYRGFRQQQADLQRARALGGIEAGPSVALVLAHESGAAVRLHGTVPSSTPPLMLHVFIGGRECGTHAMEEGPFEIVIRPPSESVAAKTIPAPLAATTYIELLTADPQREPYLIACAEIISGNGVAV